MKKSTLTLLLVVLFVLFQTSCSLLTDASGDEPAKDENESPAAEVESDSGAVPSTDGEVSEDVSASQSSSETVVALHYPLVDTGQQYCYSETVSIPCPASGAPFFGQDAQYLGEPPAYSDNGDGTITDLTSGLMWSQDPGAKVTFKEAREGAETFNLGDYSDWRLPSIKELYSLILFSGNDPSGCQTLDMCPNLVPFIDNSVFIFNYGDTNVGERIIDAQFISSTEYLGQAEGPPLIFGVNFADGRIKGYPVGPGPGEEAEKRFFRLYVRANQNYGLNNFADNGDGTISDQGTGLMWMQTDNQQVSLWVEALNYCENLEWAGHTDWRLPNAKELQSIVDYSRAPDKTNSAAIASLFNSTPITNEAGNPDYGFYWTSTTQVNRNRGGASAVYVAFGRALGYFQENWQDVHGAGAQRSDLKTGDPAAFPTGHGPQGDAVRISNYARCVRAGFQGDVKVGGETDPLVIQGSGNLPSQEEIQDQIPEEGEQPKLPPNEAVNACSGLTDGADCSFNGPTGTVNGTCRDLIGQLACAPNLGLPGLP
jgi:hypothetical protein